MTCMNIIAKTPFLKGVNKRGWKVDFDWLIANDTNYVKVLEGKYKQEDLSVDFIIKNAGIPS